MTETTCPLFDTPNCRFLSQECIIVPYALLIEDPKTKRLSAGSTLHKKEPVGLLCNNDGEWVTDKKKLCPARWGLHRQHYGGRMGGVYPDSQIVVAPSILFRVD